MGSQAVMSWEAAATAAVCCCDSPAPSDPRRGAISEALESIRI